MAIQNHVWSHGCLEWRFDEASQQLFRGYLYANANRKLVEGERTVKRRPCIRSVLHGPARVVLIQSGLHVQCSRQRQAIYRLQVEAVFNAPLRLDQTLMAEPATALAIIFERNVVRKEINKMNSPARGGGFGHLR